MRHFFSVRPFPAACPIASLALGVAMPAAPRLLVAVSGRAQRLTPGDAGTYRAAVLLPAVATRADPHLALTPHAQEQSGIVHRSPPGEEDWTIRRYTRILATEPCESADLGAAPDVTVKSFSPGLRQPLRRTRSNPSQCVPSPAGEFRSREPATHVVSGANQIQPEEFEAKQGASARNSARHRRIAMTRMFAKYARVSVAAYTSSSGGRESIYDCVSSSLCRYRPTTLHTISRSLGVSSTVP